MGCGLKLEWIPESFTFYRSLSYTDRLSKIFRRENLSNDSVHPQLVYLFARQL